MGEFLGSLVGAGAGLIGQNQQTQANIGLQNAAENWDTQMSDTAVQRGVADERAAGMNPMLAVMGNSASAPTIPPVSEPNPAASAGMGASSAQSMMSFGSSLDNTKADTTLKHNQADKVGYDSMHGYNENKKDVAMMDDDIRANKARADIAEALSTTAKNKQTVERMFPILTGGADAIFGRAGVGANTASKVGSLLGEF